MKRPTAVLAEDEPLLLGELEQALQALWPELEIVARAADGLQALQALESQRPDAMFLDIRLPVLSGLEVARVASGRCHVVFATAYDEFALAAFEQGAVDYLLKPLSPARLATTVARLRARIGERPQHLEPVLEALAPAHGPRRRPLRWITFAHGRSLQFVTCAEVCYFQADHKYTRVVTPTLEPLIDKPIRQLADELDPEDFLQIHRGTIVNLNAVAAVDRDLRGGLSVRLRQRPERLVVGPSFVHAFRLL